MGQGDPKNCHHLIPGELFDVTFIFDDHFGNLADDLAYQVFDFFRVQALRQCGVAGDICKQNRNVLAFAGNLFPFGADLLSVSS